MPREPDIQLGAYTTTLDEFKYTEQDADNDVKTDMTFTPGELAECSLNDVLKHRKTAQLVRLFDKHMRTGDEPYKGPEITVESLQDSSEHHGELLDFIHWLPLRQSPATAGRVRRIAVNSLKRLQQINALRRHAKRVEEGGLEATV